MGNKINPSENSGNYVLMGNGNCFNKIIQGIKEPSSKTSFWKSVATVVGVLAGIATILTFLIIYVC